jgi:hypothetical protein
MTHEADNCYNAWMCGYVNVRMCKGIIGLGVPRFYVKTIIFNQFDIMIDQQRRKKLAFHLRHLSVGLISNDQFESRIMDDVTRGWLPSNTTNPSMRNLMTRL